MLQCVCVCNVCLCMRASALYRHGGDDLLHFICQLLLLGLFILLECLDDLKHTQEHTHKDTHCKPRTLWLVSYRSRKNIHVPKYRFARPAAYLLSGVSILMIKHYTFHLADAFIRSDSRCYTVDTATGSSSGLRVLLKDTSTWLNRLCVLLHLIKGDVPCTFFQVHTCILAFWNKFTGFNVKK